MVKEINKDVFIDDKNISNQSNNFNKNTIIEFYQKTCPHCIAMVKTYDELSEEFPDIDFLKIDIAENFELAEQFNIDATPTFIFFPLKNKYLINVGGMNKTDFKQKIKHVFSL